MLSELKDIEVTGRVIIDLDSDDEPILIQNGDTILIPEITNQIYVYGSVNNNGSALYSKGQDFEFYIKKKGGFTEAADKKNIYVLSPNGETYKLEYKKNLFTSAGKEIEI